MITGLDHVVILLNDLAKGAAAYELALGVKPAWRSQSEGTQAELFTLDNITLELLAPFGTGATADRLRTLLKLRGEGLASLCFGVEDIARMHDRLERLALKPDPIAEVEGRDSDSGATLHWKRTRAATETTRGVRMFFLELAGERPRSEVCAPAPISGIDHVVISTADTERAAGLYGARLGLDMTLDRTSQERGRFMLFRCGDLTFEIVNRPVAGSDEAIDKLWGLSWRVADLAATRERLIKAGLKLTDIRIGRTSGSQVATVREGICGTPTLLVQPASKG
jgi:catechol 2,3-dioxygenase-like lactoylglutathione lyase family enzyme